MKKLLCLLVLVSLSSSAYTIKNNTDGVFYVKVSYGKWWFVHTYRLHPFEQLSTMDGLVPNTSITFDIYNKVFSHNETELVNGTEHTHAIYNDYEQFVTDLTTTTITIHGFQDQWILTKQQ